jgi:hypothetical protein
MDITASMMATVRNRTFPKATNASNISLKEQEMGRQNYAGVNARGCVGVRVHSRDTNVTLNLFLCH